MGNSLQRITPVVRDVGFTVRRLLPTALCRTVGPFVFLDHMGPAVFAPDNTEGDVRPHPHIGLATVTFLTQGAMLHRDSLGSLQRIEPGDINLMVAGRGIVHSERFPPDIRRAGRMVEGLQMWLALPLAEEACEPSFHHYPAARLPSVSWEGGALQVLIGEACGQRSPVRTFSDTRYLHWQLAAGSQWMVPAGVAEQAMYLLAGEVGIGQEVFGPGELVILPASSTTLVANSAARGVLFGGASLDAPRYLDWNFVASQRASLIAAREAWQAGRFAMVPGETEFIPLP